MLYCCSLWIDRKIQTILGHFPVYSTPPLFLSNAWYSCFAIIPIVVSLYWDSPGNLVSFANSSEAALLKNHRAILMDGGIYAGMLSINVIPTAVTSCILLHFSYLSNSRIEILGADNCASCVQRVKLFTAYATTMSMA